MQPVTLIILLSLLQYWIFSLLVARYRTKVLAPAITGPPEFERALRIQVNTHERLIVFIPSVWLFGALVSVPWATGLGVAFLLARTLYAIGYLRSPGKRTLGSWLSFTVELALLAGALIGLGLNWNMLS